MENKKLTKKDYYGMLKEIVLTSDVDNKEELEAFIDRQVEIIDNKAEKAKERAAEKKAEGDELRAAIKSVLTEDYQSADDILAQLEGDDLSKAKIIARLTQLVNNGDAEKAQAKTEDGKKFMTYRLK